MLSAFTAKPRQGHFEALLHILSYLNLHGRSKLVLVDDSVVKVDDEIEADWVILYPEAKEDVPSNAPKPRGKSVQTTGFVDADHAGDPVTRRSRTGIQIYLNRAPVEW
jgi:hypothetical protein